ncbi:hypothetical protein HDU97_004496 [Phlyctochytrium planicorne]|nr:hypothetical protein HDU97_004496 [Phlyctochytrium planicorne]
MPVFTKAPENCTGIHPSVVAADITISKLVHEHLAEFTCGDQCNGVLSGDLSGTNVQDAWKELKTSVGSVAPFCSSVLYARGDSVNGIAVNLLAAPTGVPETTTTTALIVPVSTQAAPAVAPTTTGSTKSSGAKKPVTFKAGALMFAVVCLVMGTFS